MKWFNYNGNFYNLYHAVSIFTECTEYASGKKWKVFSTFVNGDTYAVTDDLFESHNDAKDFIKEMLK